MNLHHLTSSDCIAAIWPGKATECRCKMCRGMCKRAACLCTPQDALRLAQNGYVDMLRSTLWLAGFATSGIPPIGMVQIDAGEGDPTEERTCPFFKKGLCQLHATGLKPTEGRLASCKTEGMTLFENPSVAVALTWVLKRNARIVEHLLNLVDPPRVEEPILL